MRDVLCEACHLCGTSGSLLHEGVRDHLFGRPGAWNLRRCDNPECGLVWLDPKPLEEDLHQAYAHYYTHGSDQQTTGGSGFQRLTPRAVAILEQLWLGALFLRAARKKIDRMFLDGIAPGRLLEVGCGAGRLTAAMQRDGWQAEGQDIDADAAENARKTYGINVHLGNLVKLRLLAESYDAIVMNHVIEHLYDPTALIRECRRLLKPGGLLVATTPNPDSFGHAKFGQAWLGLDPPRHLHLFPPSALSSIARMAGFRRWDVWTTPARAGRFLAASLDIRRSGHHQMRGRITLSQIVAAAWYQLAARIMYIWADKSGEEAVLRARK